MAPQNRTHRRPSDRPDEVVEKGDIYFAYRPKIGETEVEGLEDIQRFFMILKPKGGKRFRLTVLGRKRLSDQDRHERIWGFVDKLVKSGRDIGTDFGEQHYATRTRGERTLPAVRPVGEGVYALLQRERSLELTYELELPDRPGEVEQELNVPRQAGYILSIRNPQKAPPPQAGLSEAAEAHYPRSLQREFHGRRFAATDPHLLDYEGAEFVLVGARTDPERAYGIDLEAEHETAQKADIFKQLKMSHPEHPLEPLLEGDWR